MVVSKRALVAGLSRAGFSVPLSPFNRKAGGGQKKPLEFAVFTAGRAVGYNCIADKRTFGSDDPAVSILRAVSVSNRRGQIGWPLWGVIIAFCLGSLANTAVALEVVRVQFGFAGQFIPEEFNIVNVEIQNRDSVAWQGNLVLSRAGDTELIAPALYVEAGGRRTVQFVPFVTEHTMEWRLKWGDKRGESLTVDNPFAGEPALVCLQDPTALRRPVQELRQFDERLFPTSVAGTSGLAEVVLDHAPRWDSVRQQAFLDWLHMGGIMHLVAGQNGKLPVFTGVLVPLNGEAQDNPVATTETPAAPPRNERMDAGQIIRHTGTLSEFQLRDFLHPPDPTKTMSRQYRGGNWGPTERLIHAMRQTVRPVHNWQLIYTMAGVYLLCLFPGSWLLGRRRFDYRLVYGAILGVAAVFGYGFNVAGARGYGEETILQTVAIVRPLAEGCEFRQWSNLFVTRSGIYQLSQNGDGAMDGNQERETFTAAVESAPKMQMKASIPPYASRGFVTQGRLACVPVRCETVDWQDAGTFKLQIRVTGLESTKVINAMAYRAFDRTVQEIPLQWDPDTKILTANSAPQPPSWLQNQQQYGYEPEVQLTLRETNAQKWKRFQEKSAKIPLTVTALNIVTANQYNQAENKASSPLTGGQIRVLILADMPVALFPDVDFAALKEGAVLYCCDLFPRAGQR